MRTESSVAYGPTPRWVSIQACCRCRTRGRRAGFGGNGWSAGRSVVWVGVQFRELSREELLAALAERDAVIAALLAEIEQLKRRVGMDSSSSSMPPGSDGLAARARRARKPGKRSPRPRGGQPGHEGHALA